MISPLQRAALFVVLFIAAESATALPRFSLITGTRCSACHFTPSGGGLRTELGWDALNKGAWRWPWQKREPVDEGGGEDLFGAPPEGSVDESGRAIPPESGATAPGDDAGAAGGFETATPLPAHEPSIPGDETTDAEPTDAQPADTEPADALPTDAQPADAQPTDAEPGDAQPADDGTATEPPAGETPGAAPAVEAHTNSFADGLITPGVDIRLQMTKIGRPPKDVRMILPMQTQLNLAVTPAEWIALYGGYNYAVTQRSYPGQSSAEATLQVQPGVTLPTLRLGFMQPSIGVRHDDHTMFTRREVAGPSTHPLIPPGYAELGAEVSYEGLHWLTVNAGVFGSKMLSEVEPSIGAIGSLADFSKPSVLGRVVLWPQDLDLGFNGELGASYFANGDFTMTNIFGGFGIADRGSILVEGLMAEYPSAQTDSANRVLPRMIRNVSVIGSYQLFSWLSLDWRYEFGQTEVADDNPAERTLAHAHQAVFGVEFFPLPYVEIRPEYRFFQNESFNKLDGYLQGQYTLQLHLFY